MWRTIIATAFMVLPMSCANASNPMFDSSNPVSCLVIFSFAANSANHMSNAAAAAKISDEMPRRMAFLAKQHGGVNWIKQVTPQSIQTGANMEAAHDEPATLKLLDDCIAKQNADPAFRSWMSKR